MKSLRHMHIGWPFKQMFQTPYIAIESLLSPLFAVWSSVCRSGGETTQHNTNDGRPNAILGNANVWTITIYGLTHPFRN